MMDSFYLLYIYILLFFPYFVFSSEEYICALRPSSCNLVCPHGYIRESTGHCACECAHDPCQRTICAKDEFCMTMGSIAKCIYQSNVIRSDCPRLTGGVCALRCITDKDCQGRLICCSNGCGRECVTPLGNFPIRAAKPIKPVTGALDRLLSAVSTLPARISQAMRETSTHPPMPYRPVFAETNLSPSANKKEKVGECPMLSNDEKNCKDMPQCTSDFECSTVQKCCPSRCGSMCTEPIKATACVHLFLSVLRLPEKSLHRGYLPTCDYLGKFEPIQCDSVECWCVDVHYGAELSGSRVLKPMRRSDMCRDPRQCTVKCAKACPHGFQMDMFGCPIATCLCKDICDHVQCNNNGDSCQLVEPDCAYPPCLPVPRCLINPCPTSTPLTLPSGVTALCAQSEQCIEGYWCHQIGFNGLGFCCKLPESKSLPGTCPIRQPRRGAQCVSKCKIDEDCPQGKCCFDGCGLSCVSMEIIPNTIRPKTIIPKKPKFQPGSIAKYNKAHLSSLVADCPDFPSMTTNCATSCRADGDCSGMKRCCRAGCSTICAYPVTSTPCFHVALTAELYALRNILKCDRAGNFEEKQCSDDGCFCVDISTGEEQSGTRKSTGQLDCKTPTPCDVVHCLSSCTYGFELDEKGCPTCLCKNPCAQVKCPQGSQCIMAHMDCYQRDNCPSQPRCVLNLCPSGEPYLSSVGVVETCSHATECPPDHFCHSLGLSSGGICCPGASRSISSGTCPSTSPSLDPTLSCELKCKSDEQCTTGEKCCFNGCGTDCKSIAVIELTTTPESSSENFEKPGQCPHFDQKQCHSTEKIDECDMDSDCVGVQKCCSNGCHRLCTYSETNTPCLQLKAALQQIGQMDRIKCRPDGSFEEVQCDRSACWCVDENGREIQGTKTSEDIVPNCKLPRKCSVPLCTVEKECRFGVLKDGNGCDTCECFNPCQGVICPESSFCVPSPIECIKPPCPEVPRCSVNPCSIGTPIVDLSSFYPLTCKQNNQCIGAASISYCSMYKNEEGLCCSGPEPRSNPGVCPRSVLPIADCSRQCTQDEECPSTQKCCYNGCGLSCMSAEFASAIHSEIHLGECMATKPLGVFCVQRSSPDECSTDEDCPSLYKCCSDGCYLRCTPPEVTSQCIHSHLALQQLYSTNPSLHVPRCSAQGEFQTVQSHYGLSWCVDDMGKEVPGTKTTGKPNCRKPRSCPVRSCNKHCPFGLKTDNDGCIVCDCIDPCSIAECPAGFVCRMVNAICFENECEAVPKCVPNSCPVGEPLIIHDSRVMAECGDDHLLPCPAGFFCQKNGFLGKGYCCLGIAPTRPSFPCAALPTMNSSIDDSPCVVSCRHSSDCPNASCCYNGCGLSCQFQTHVPSSISSGVSLPQLTVPIIDHPTFSKHSSIKPKKIIKATNEVLVVPQVEHSITPIITSAVKAEKGSLSLVDKIGECPLIEMNPGCREECRHDQQCAGYLKCCKAGCGAVCVEPKITTSCIHRLLSYSREFRKSGSLLPPPVQCNSDGSFRQHQCDITSRQCWCVTKSGLEVVGTRTSSSAALPDCNKPMICSTSCSGHKCPYGLRLADNGCPYNGVCSCRNPCRDLICSHASLKCSLVPVQCIGSSCPLQPKCLPNICDSSPYIGDEYSNPKSCSSDDECDHGRCVHSASLLGYGICCSIPIPATTPPEIQSEPITTNCSILRTAIELLYGRGAVVKMIQPNCEEHTGLFSAIQCDASGTCWCVEQDNGDEIHGTRMMNAIGKNVCAAPRICSHHCIQSICPFGLLLDRYGCPRADCICQSPCDLVECRNSEICVLRQPFCSEGSCKPVPVCQPTPCSPGQHPAVEPKTKQQFYCKDNGELCPTGFFCAGFDSSGGGLCCPGREPALTPKKWNHWSCPHGDPFASSSDGTALTCTVTANGCPPTHYCSTKAGERKGICCVSRRYVCNLPSDRGPCSVSVPRYSYSSNNQSCTRFEYGGCAGNLNNFATLADCDGFCQGVGVDLATAMADSAIDNIESYQLGFSLTGPQVSSNSRNIAEESVAAYIAEKFGVPRGSIEEIHIKDDNVVRFMIRDVEARDIARNISEAVANGKLSMTIEGSMYRAEPQTWFAHQISEEPTSAKTARIVFWVILLVAFTFAAVVFVALCLICMFMYNSSAKETQSLRGSTPANFVSNSLVVERLSRQQNRQNNNRIFSRDEAAPSSSGGRLLSDTLNRSNAPSRNDRSITTMYY